jgi:amino acid transporter
VRPGGKAGVTVATAAPPRQLKRIMSLGQLVLFGIAFVGPTAPFPMFGIVDTVSHGHMALAYTVGMLAMIITAYGYGKMSSVFPAAGSAYTYAQRSLHPLAGYLTGWTMMLDYLLLPLMSVIYLAITAHRFIPVVPKGVWLVFFALGITIVNFFGLKVTNRANFIMTAIMTAILGGFLVAAVTALVRGAGMGVLFSLKPFYDPANFSVSALMAGTSIAAFSYLGFDGVSTLAEDSRHPTRDIGRATVIVCLACGLMFIAQAYFGQLAWPNFRTFPDVDTAFLDISRLVGGVRLMSMVTLALVVGGIASAVTGQASASRLLFGMGRDELLPSRIFAYIHPKYSTPTYAVLSMGVITLLAGFFFSFQKAAEAINFGALLGFMCVNLSVISHYYIRLKLRRGFYFVSNLLVPAAGFVVCLYIFLNLSVTAKWIGTVWAVVGMIYIAIRTSGFRKELRLPE